MIIKISPFYALCYKDVGQVTPKGNRGVVVRDRKSCLKCRPVQGNPLYVYVLSNHRVQSHHATWHKHKESGNKSLSACSTNSRKPNLYVSLLTNPLLFPVKRKKHTINPRWVMRMSQQQKLLDSKLRKKRSFRS